MSEPPKRITLVRHGESEANVTGHWQGHGDSPLSPHGRTQAQALAGRLADGAWRFDRVESSDLTRARTTADAVAERLGSDVRSDSIYREIDVGSWEGLSRAEVKERFPHEIEALQRGEDVPIGGGESWAGMARRAEGAIRALAAELAPGQHGAIFAHGGFVASAVARMCAIARSRPTRLGHMTNTSVTTLVFDGERIRLERFNDTAHLGGVGAWAEGEREQGATLVSLLADESDWFEREAEYRYGTGGIESPDLNSALTLLHQKHPGARVALHVPADEAHSLAQRVLGSQTLGAKRGVSHVVVRGDHRALADYASRPSFV